jgi:hypothetical protein
MAAPFVLFTILSVVGQAAGQGNVDDAEARLDYMKQSLAVHALESLDRPKATYRLRDDPVLRFNNPVGAVKDGALFLWLDANDRPVAAVQVFKHTDGSWFHAFSSLSTAPLRWGEVWNPGQAGVEFKPVPGASKPAGSAEQRLRQMREITKGFTAEMNLDLKTWHKLRLLSKPLARYGKTGTTVTDGGLFAFVLTTDPEAFLLLEARDGTDGLEWQYALAPEASAPIRCSWKGRDVWNFQETSTHSRTPYFVSRVPR